MGSAGFLSILQQEAALCGWEIGPRTCPCRYRAQSCCFLRERDRMGSRSRALPGLALVTGELLGWVQGKAMGNLKKRLKNRFWCNVGRLAVSHCERLGFFRSAACFVMNKLFAQLILRLYKHFQCTKCYMNTKHGTRGFVAPEQYTAEV